MNNALALSNTSLLKQLRPGQKELYELVVKKVELDEPITLNEAIDLYIAHGCQDVRDGVPYTAPPYWEGSFSADDYVPMDEYTKKVYASAWLKANLGSLVLKGFLKVTPMVDLKRLE